MVTFMTERAVNRRCTKCQTVKPLADYYRRKTGPDGYHTICKQCLAADQHVYYLANREQIVAARRARWEQRDEAKREQQEVVRRAWYAKNRATLSEASRARRLEIKLAVLRHYGPACTCCGEYDSRMLTIEHSNGDGAAHRLQTFGVRTIGATFYRWLVAEGFPDDLGLSVLCGSCNQFSHHNQGVCPHQDPSPAHLTSTDAAVINARIAWLNSQLEAETQKRDSVRAVGANTNAS